MTDARNLQAYEKLRDACFKEGYLEDQSKTKQIALAMFRQNWDTGWYVAEDSSFSEDASRMFLQVTQAIIEGNINSIYECSQSPIERMFLCSFLIHSVFVHPWRINITGPIDMNTYPDVYRARYHECERVYALYSDVPNFKVSEFLDFIRARPSIPEEERKQMEYHLFFERTCDLYNGLHIALQPTIQIEGRTLRPDIFVWIPSQPAFKLVVECDGFAYHSDKTAFSRDRVRDRMLQQHGYQVFRFSGQEIYKSPVKTSLDFINYLFSLIPDEKVSQDEDAPQKVNDEHEPTGGQRKPTGNKKKQTRKQAEHHRKRNRRR